MIFDICKNGHKYEVTLEQTTCPYCDLEEKSLPFDQRYLKEEKIAEGGMGSVYKVKDVELNRTVALKKIKGDSKERLLRFKREIFTLAKLNHPNIVHIFDFYDDSSFYYTMEYIRGKPLDKYIEIIEKQPEKILDIFLQIAKTIAYFHEKKIIHRDIKPQNIIVNNENTPKIVDFGLAKNLDSAEELSTTREIIGTREYMSPEQRLDSTACNEQTDIYSFAATIYRCITYTSSYQEDISIDIRRPCSIRSNISADLDAICVKGLEKKCSRRYHKMAQIVEDFECSISKKPLKHAKLPNIFTPTSKFILRHPIAVSLVALFIIATLFFASFFLYQWNRANTQQQISRKNLGKSYVKQAQIAASEQNYFTAKMLASHAIASGENSLLKKNSHDWHKAQEIITQYPDIRLLWHSPIYHQHGNYITALCFSKKGILASASSDMTVKVWENNTLTQTFEEHEDIVTDLIFSHKYNAFISSSRDASIRMWDTNKGKTKIFLGHTSAITSICANGDLLVSGDSEGNIKIWDLASAEQKASWKTHPIQKILITPDRGNIIVATSNNVVSKWNLLSQNKLQIFATKTTITDICMSKSQIFASTFNGFIYAWDTENKLRILYSSTKPIHKIFFSSIGLLFASAENIYISKNEKNTILCKNIPQIYAMAEHGTQIAMAGNHRTINIYDTHKKKFIPKLANPQQIKNTSFSKNGKYILAIAGKQLFIWNAHSKKEKILSWNEEIVCACFLSQKETKVAVMQENGILRIIDHEQNQEELFKAHSFKGYWAAYVNTSIITSGNDGIKIWRDKNATIISSTKNYSFSVNNNLLFFKERIHKKTYIVSYDISKKMRLEKKILVPKNGTVLFFSHYFAISFFDGTGEIWDATTMSKWISLPNMYSNIAAIAITPDNQKIAIATYLSSILLWDTQEKKQITSIRLKESANDLAFNHDGKTLLTAHFGYVSLWSTLFSKDTHTYYIDNTDEIKSLAFHPSLPLIALIDYHSKVQVWDIKKRKLVFENRDTTRQRGFSVQFINSKDLFVSKMKNLQIFDIFSGKKKINIRTETRSISVISKKGYIASKKWINGDIILQQYKNGKISEPFHTIKNLDDNQTNITFSSDATFFVSVLNGNIIGMWETMSGKLLGQFNGHNDLPSCFAISPDQKTLISGSQDRYVKIWDIPTQKLQKSLFHQERVLDIAVDFERNIIISVGPGGIVKMWKQYVPTVLQAHNSRVFSTALKENIFVTSSKNDFKTWSTNISFPQYSQYLQMYHVKNFNTVWKKQALMNNHILSAKKSPKFTPSNTSYLRKNK